MAASKKNNTVTPMIDNFVEKQYEPCHRVHTHYSGHHIYLGDITAANDHQFIRNQKIEAVVTASADMEHLAYDRHVHHHVYNLLDVSSENLGKHFGNFYDMMEGELIRTNVLVHCFAGISRSATLVISYLMKKNNWTFKTAIAEVRRYRPQVLPNLGFERQLKAYEKELKVGSTDTQVNAASSLTRKYISKTSESRKHQQLKNVSVGLPEIIALGKTLGRSQVPISTPLFEHPSSQMQSRKARRHIPHFQQQKQQLPGLNIESSSRQYPYNPTPKRAPLRSLRKRSLSNNRNNSHKEDGGGFLQDLQKQMKYEKPAIIQNRFVLRNIKFTTEKTIRGIGL